MCEQREWVSVSEGLPDLGERVWTTSLMTNKQYSQAGVSHRFFDYSIGKDGKRGGEKWAGDHHNPSHWMSLPALPKTQP